MEYLNSDKISRVVVSNSVFAILPILLTWFSSPVAKVLNAVFPLLYLECVIAKSKNMHVHVSELLYVIE